MKKGKVARVAGFVGALGVSAVLVTTAVQGTGAYFTDSQNGNLYASSGSLQITATGTGINFSGLNPGQDRSQTVNYTLTSTSTGNADVWLVFDSTTAAYGAFTGAKDPAGTAYAGVTDGGMGQYGHFKVVAPTGQFESYNLQLPSVADATDQNGYTSAGSANNCVVDSNGHGGSSVQHTIGAGTDIAECGVPAAILLTSNLEPGHSSSAAITFGLTGKQTQQGQPNDPNVPFKIVATQPNVRPGASW